MKEKILKIILFVVCLFLGISCYHYIFRLKLDEADTMKIFYEQKKNSIDVLCLGSSQVFGSINPAILYQNYGIASFDLCAAGLSTEGVYFYLQEALKTQTPKVIVVGCDYAYDLAEDVGTEIAYQWSGGMKTSTNRIEFIKNIVKSENFLDVFLRYPINHVRYNDLQERDFLPYRGDAYHRYYKGNRVFYSKYPIEEYEVYPYVKEVGEIPKETRFYFEKINELANEVGAKLIIYSPPVCRTSEDQMTINAIGAWAKNKKITFLDLNSCREELGIDMKKEMNDHVHVNYLGQVKTSNYVAKFLSDNYDLPDRRGENGYESWEMCVEDYNTVFRDLNLTLYDGNLAGYIELLEQDDYSLLISARGDTILGYLQNSIEIPGWIGKYQQELVSDELIMLKSGAIQKIVSGKYYDYGGHDISISETGLVYDSAIINFDKEILFIAVFDDTQKSIIEYRTFYYDENLKDWVMQFQNESLALIWYKR